MGLFVVAERIRGDDVQLCGGGPRGDGLAQGGFPRRRLVVAVDARRRRDGGVGGDQLEAAALRSELIHGRGVEIAREKQVGEGDGEQAAQLRGVGLGIADRLGEK